jgi:hypothetical protein
MTTVCQRPGFVVSLAPTSEPRIQILRMDVSEMPVGDDLDAIILMISTFIQHHEGRLVIHVRHVDTDKLNPPDMQGMLSIVGKLMEMKDVVDTKLKGTIVQGTCIDDIVIMAKNLYLSLYKPKKPFDIVASDTDVQLFLNGILEHEAEKRKRKESKGR